MIGFAAVWAFLLLPAPALVWAFAPPAPDRGALRPPASLSAALTLLAGTGGGLTRAPAGLTLRALGWVALIIALAGPYRAERPLVTPTGRDVVIALDLSASMGEADLAGAARPRIEIAREVLGGFIRARAGDRIAVIGFGTEAFLITPFTFDHAAAAEMMAEMTIGLPGRRTDLGQAIGLAVRLLRDAPAAERLLVMVSDGETNAGALAARDAAEMAAGIGLRVEAIGFAGEIDSESQDHMREVAALTGGGFHAAASAADLARIAEGLTPVAAPSPRTARRDLAWPFILAALAAAGGIVLRDRWGR